MLNLPHNCERPCTCQEKFHTTNLVVLTGGPGAGKTAALEFVRKVLCTHVAILPEAASILFSGGFWRLDSATARRAAQKAIFHVQREMENLVLEEKSWAMALCDRGTLDGIAYWPGSEAEYLKDLNINLESEHAKYRAVLHLRSPGIESGYNYQNPIRIETAEQASIIDEKIHEAWKRHPNYFLIESTQDFREKINLTTKYIQSFVPSCCRGHFLT